MDLTQEQLGEKLAQVLRDRDAAIEALDKARSLVTLHDGAIQMIQLLIQEAAQSAQEVPAMDNVPTPIRRARSARKKAD